MAKQDEVRRNEAADRERDQEWLATGRDPARAAPKVRGRGTPRGRRHEEQSGTAPPNEGFGEFGWGEGDELYEVLLQAGAFVPHRAGKEPRRYKRVDEQIEEEINDRLTWHRDIDASRIDVSARRGVVTLAGTVDSQFDKHLATDIAEDVDGVKDVRNMLGILPGF